MIYHILNGDSLAHTFRDTFIEGEIIVTREALIEGSLEGDTLEEFWNTRAITLGITHKEYYDTSVKEFMKIMNAPHGSVFNLWFEYDLFCQVNMWFLLSLIYNSAGNKKVYAVYSSYINKEDKNFWNGFGPADTNDLGNCYTNRILLNEKNILFGTELWKKYKANDLQGLKILSEEQTPAFPYIKEVIQAHIDRFPGKGRKGRPEKVIEGILKNTSRGFNSVFQEFRKRESIYGFGDVQFKKIYDRVIHNR
ncbi:MAG: DUF1835 domain-containing protein [Bacteroidetes bacterium]|nr:DUF1835 domain-containing protein [Bacteroidota bacterium]